jgi:hypothetical protein
LDIHGAVPAVNRSFARFAKAPFHGGDRERGSDAFERGDDAVVAEDEWIEPVRDVAT